MNPQGARILGLIATHLVNLKSLNISSNSMNILPSEMVGLQSIAELDLSYNAIWERSLSDVVYKLTTLQRLNLCGALNGDVNEKVCIIDREAIEQASKPTNKQTHKQIILGLLFTFSNYTALRYERIGRQRK